MTGIAVRGAYVLTKAEGVLRATLIGAGSEVALALTARTLPQAEGVPTAAVSMPSWEAFAAQDAECRRDVIPRGKFRVAVEAALRFG
jgi:transketolase